MLWNRQSSLTGFGFVGFSKPVNSFLGDIDATSVKRHGACDTLSYKVSQALEFAKNRVEINKKRILFFNLYV